MGRPICGQRLCSGFYVMLCLGTRTHYKPEDDTKTYIYRSLEFLCVLFTSSVLVFILMDGEHPYYSRLMMRSKWHVCGLVVMS